jgi:hypothetical protein
MDKNEAPEEATVRYLRILVTVLSVTMSAGFVIMVTLFVMRFRDLGRVSVPEAITLPAGVEAEAFTMGKSFYAVVAGEEILIYSRVTGDLRQRIAIESE